MIGGGAAGFSAIVKYSELTEMNSKIALISRGPLGGTCVNTGCVPSKYFIERAKLFKLIGRTGLKWKEYGLADIFSEIREVVTLLRKEKYEDLLNSYGNTDLYIGSAKIIDKNTVKVELRKGDSINIKGRKIIIATGSRPSIPNIKGLDSIDYYTTDTIWSISYEPSKILIVGSGAVGLELAQAFSRIGIDTYVVEVLDRPLPNLEPEISLEVLNMLSSENVKFFLKSRVVEFIDKKSYIEAKIATNRGIETIDIDAVLIATGRKPNSDDLNLNSLGIEIDKFGFIKVSPDLRTAVPNIYAAGDVAKTPKPAFLETLAAREGALAAMNIFDHGNRSIDYATVPVAIFTDPEIAYVGLTESNVVKIYGSCSCRLVRFSDLPKSRILGESHGLAKLIIDPDSKRVLGFHTLAPQASEFITLVSLAIKHGYRFNDLIDIIQIFPSSSEITKASAQAFIRRIDRMPCCVE